MAFLTSLGVAAGYLIAGTVGTLVAFSLAVVMNGFAYCFLDRIALAMAGAREVSVADAPDLHRMVESLAMASGVPKPWIYLSSDASPNAFATGRSPRHAALRKLDISQRRLPSERAQPASAHLYIVNPLSGQALAGLFSTHPPVRERVRRLEAMARPTSWQGRPNSEPPPPASPGTPPTSREREA